MLSERPDLTIWFYNIKIYPMQARNKLSKPLQKASDTHNRHSLFVE